MTAQDKIDEAAARGTSARNKTALAIRDAVPQIGNRLPVYMPRGTAERYAAIAIDTYIGSPSLQRCSPQSIVRGVVLAAEYGLALDGVLGHAYLVPYSIKGVMTAQFQIGYRGLVELMYRTKVVELVNSDVVCENDPLWDWEQGTNAYLRHRPSADRGKPEGKSDGGTRLHAYALAKMPGGHSFVVLNESDVLEHRACSKAYQRNPGESIWKKWPDIAWKKSAVRELSKSVPMATEVFADVRRAATMDEKMERGEVAIVDAEVVDVPPEAEPTGDRPPGPGEGE